MGKNKKFWNWARDADDERVLYFDGKFLTRLGGATKSHRGSFVTNFSPARATSQSGSTLPAGIAWRLHRFTPC